jgi:hypothetical protein
MTVGWVRARSQSGFDSSNHTPTKSIAHDIMGLNGQNVTVQIVVLVLIEKVVELLLHHII